MLIMSRKTRECFVIGGQTAFDRLLKITVIDVGENGVKLGIEVADDVAVQTGEQWRHTGLDSEHELPPQAAVVHSSPCQLLGFPQSMPGKSPICAAARTDPIC